MIVAAGGTLADSVCVAGRSLIALLDGLFTLRLDREVLLCSVPEGGALAIIDGLGGSGRGSAVLPSSWLGAGLFGEANGRSTLNAVERSRRGRGALPAGGWVAAALSEESLVGRV